MEFNVPFQHKYGYIRDDNVAGLVSPILRIMLINHCELLVLHLHKCISSTSNSVRLCQQLLPTNSITAAPSTLLFQLPIVPDQPQICANETKPNPNVALTRILTLTLVTQRCNMIGWSVAARCYWSGAIVDTDVLSEWPVSCTELFLWQHQREKLQHWLDCWEKSGNYTVPGEWSPWTNATSRSVSSQKQQQQAKPLLPDNILQASEKQKWANDSKLITSSLTTAKLQNEHSWNDRIY